MMSLCLICDNSSSPYTIHPFQVMDPSVPRSCKDWLMLNGDVGRIRTDHGWKGVTDESMTMVNMVDLSDVLVTGSLVD